jgi:hypothetical protein
MAVRGGEQSVDATMRATPFRPAIILQQGGPERGAPPEPASAR